MNSLSHLSEYSSSFLHLEGEAPIFQINSLHDYNEMNLTEFFPPFSLDEENSKLFFEHNKIFCDFSETKSKSSEESNIALLKKKRGRKNNKIDRQHTEYKNDCKMAKIQVSYFSFLIKLINCIMKRFNINYYFLDLSGKYKSNINQMFRNSLNNKTIKKILLEAPISGKFKKNKNYNIEVYNKLVKEGNNLLINILDKNFLFFFKNIYYANKRKLDLSLFGFDPCEIELTNDIKMFEDLLLKRKSQDFIKYKKEMEKCAEKYFII